MKHENSSCLPFLRLGVLVNPVAGLGGTRALKGSDGLTGLDLDVAESRACARLAETLALLRPWAERLEILCAGGIMGAAVVEAAGLYGRVVHVPAVPTTASDTSAAARALCAAGSELLLFAGGDGTARDLCAADIRIPVLGVPAGVKMHSGVFAINPASAAEMIIRLLAGTSMLVESAEVRDLDEVALQAGRVQPRFYGELPTLIDARLVQQVKCASADDEELAQTEIAAHVRENLDPDTLYLFGPGSTVAMIMDGLGLAHTVLGFDAVLDGRLVGQDLDSDAIAALARDRTFRIVLTATGGQGILIGRGNQQLTPALLRQAGRDSLWVVATAAKLRALDGRPLRLDTGDAELNKAWRGFIPVTTGYGQQQLHYLE